MKWTESAITSQLGNGIQAMIMYGTIVGGGTALPGGGTAHVSLCEG
jgi:hypothetical protein